MPELNRRFWVKPAEAADVHQGLPKNLAETLCWEEDRVVQRDWTVAWNGRWFQIARHHEGLCLAGKRVLVRALRDGSVQLWKGTQKLVWRELPGRPLPASPTRPPKAQAKLAKPPASHPWRQWRGSAGQQFWRGVKAAGRAARQASRPLRSASVLLVAGGRRVILIAHCLRSDTEKSCKTTPSPLNDFTRSKLPRWS